MMNNTLGNIKEKFNSSSLTKSEFINEAFQIHKKLFEYSKIIQSTDIDQILISPEGVYFNINDNKLCLTCPPNEARVAPLEIMNFGSYEPEETHIINILSENTKSILDIGANIGLYSVRLASNNPNARVYAFEPIPEFYSYLQKNISLNDIGNQVLCYNYGLSDSCGSVEFFIAPNNGTNASLTNVADAKDIRKVVGLTTTLDQWCDNNRVIPDLIKCDVEGAELLVFRGGYKTLKEYQPIIFTELLRKWAKPFGYHPNDVLTFFKELGYIPFSIGEKTSEVQTVTNETKETNYVFLHKDSHLELISRLGKL